MKVTTGFLLVGMFFIPMTTILAQHGGGRGGGGGGGMHMGGGGGGMHMGSGMPGGMHMGGSPGFPGGGFGGPSFSAPHFSAPHYPATQNAVPHYSAPNSYGLPPSVSHAYGNPSYGVHPAVPGYHLPTTGYHAPYGGYSPYAGSNYYAQHNYGAYVPPTVHPRSVHYYSFTLGLPYAFGYGNYYYPGYYSYLYGSPYGYSQPLYGAYGNSYNYYTYPQYNYGSAYPSDAAYAQNYGTDGAVTAAKPAVDLLADAKTLFKAGRYFEAIKSAGQAAEQQYDSPTLHELMSLSMFALGDFRGAAIEAHAVIYYGHPSDWATISSYYGDPNKYQEQLRALEAQVKAQPEDAAATFLLGYHYAMLGHKDDAIKTLTEAVKLTPDDIQAKKLLYPLEGKEPPKDNVPQPPQPSSNQPPADPAVDQNLSAPNNSQSAVGDDGSSTVEQGAGTDGME